MGTLASACSRPEAAATTSDRNSGRFRIPALTAQTVTIQVAERCTATKANGQPCGAYATKTGKCAGHSRLGFAADPSTFAKLGNRRSAEVRQEKAEQRRKTYLDILAEELENDALQNVEAMRKAASEGDWRALETWVTRVHGKPVERVETTANSLDPASLTSVQRAELRRRLVSEHPELLELVPAVERVTKSEVSDLQDVDTAGTA